MKYAGLIWATIQGLLLITGVAWLLWLFRENFVSAEPHLPWGAFVLIAGAAFGAAFGFSAKNCARQVREMKEPEKDN